MKFLSTFETAEKWGISHRRVSILCNQGRISGAQRAGSRWIIPEGRASMLPGADRLSVSIEGMENPICTQNARGQPG